MKTKHTIILVALIVLLAACSSDSPDNLEPLVTTLPALYVTRTSATLYGRVTLRGEDSSMSATFRFGDTEAMLSAARAETADSGRLMLPLSGLTPGVTYYFQLTTTNGRAVVSGAVRHFTTLPNVLATVTAAEVLSQGPLSAIVGFDVTDDGGDPIREAGLYVAGGTQTAMAPPASARKVVASQSASDRYGWCALVSGLQPHSAYTAWPYAVNGIGETVGAAVAFTTTEALTVTEGGQLAQLMQQTEGATGALTVTGPLNGDDLHAIRRQNYSVIDLTEARIVAGGQPYDGSRYAVNDVVGYGLFASLAQLTDVRLPSSATTVESEAFRDCTSLVSVTLPAHVASVKPSTGCTALAAIHVPESNTVYRSDNGVLTDAGQTDLVWFPMGKTGRYALPQTIRRLGDYAFSGCRLTEVTLPAGLTEMGQGVFYRSAIEEAVLPDGLKTLPQSTFADCQHLRSVTLGTGTELLGNYAFSASALQQLHVRTTTPPVCGSNAFTSTDGRNLFRQCTLYVPSGSKEVYRNHAMWGQFRTIVEE